MTRREHPTGQPASIAPARPKRSARSGWRQWVTTGLLGVAAFMALLFIVDLRSLERGNRLYREGQVTAAIERYRALEPGSSGREAYNLGTSLLALGSPEADIHLADGAAGQDSLTRQRAYYNLAYAQLVRVEPSLEPDSAMVLLKKSIGNGRLAVRLDANDQDAIWNLALAQRMLDSLSTLPVESPGVESSGQDETVIDMTSITRSEDGTGQSGPEPENPPPTESSGQRLAAAQGARESWATQDDGPLTEADAQDLIDNLTDSPERLLRGILWSQRPDVAWWAGQGYPGGNW